MFPMLIMFLPIIKSPTPALGINTKHKIKLDNDAGRSFLHSEQAKNVKISMKDIGAPLHCEDDLKKLVIKN